MHLRVLKIWYLKMIYREMVRLVITSCKCTTLLMQHCHLQAHLDFYTLDYE